MDMTVFQRMTREELVAEAEQYGVVIDDDTTREEIIASLRALAEGEATSPFGTARTLLSRVVDRVKTALPSRSRDSKPPPAPTDGPASRRRGILRRRSSLPPDPAENRAMDHDTSKVGPSAAPSKDGPSRRDGSDQGGSGGHSAEVPIRTKTFARLLMHQGHLDRAVAVYQELMQDPAHASDPDLRAELSGLRAQLKARTEALRKEHPTGEVMASIVDGRSLLLSWSITEDGVAIARQLLAHDGGMDDATLVARTVVVAADEAGGIETHQHDQSNIETAGEWILHELPRPSRCTAAVGLLQGERFVSIAHGDEVVVGPPEVGGR